MSHPTLPDDITAGDVGHIGHHEAIHEFIGTVVLVLSGTAGARPLATAVDEGTLYWATDTAALSRSDGATWTALSAGATSHGALTGVTADQHHNEDHASRHATAGADPLAPGDIGAATTGHNHDADYADITEGVTNGDSHNHLGGDGAQIAHTSLGSVSKDQHHNEDHAARHVDGGADELDVADLASGAATSGQAPLADGAGGVAWGDVSGGGGDVVHAEMNGTAVTLTNSDVTIVTEDIGDVAVGDVLEMELVGLMQNDSGFTFTYVITPDFDAQFDPEYTWENVSDVNTVYITLRVKAWLVVKSTSLAYMYIEIENGATSAMNAGVYYESNAAGSMGRAWDTVAANLTGTVTAAIKIRSSGANAGQTFLPLSWVVRKVSSS